MGQCDSCGKSSLKTRRLELGGGSGIKLCDNCLKKEVAWRSMRNETLEPRAKFRTDYKF